MDLDLDLDLDLSWYLDLDFVGVVGVVGGGVVSAVECGWLVRTNASSTM